MKLNKPIKKYTGLLVSAVFLLLLVLSSCEMGTGPQGVLEESEDLATLTIAVPNIAPWLQEKFESQDMTTKAWLYGDSIGFGIFDTDNILVDSIYTSLQFQPGDGLPSTQVTAWEIPPGTYYLYCFVWNYSSQLYITTDTGSGGEASVWGIYPAEQPDRDNPTVPFTVSEGDNLSVTITNFPAVPTDIANDDWPATATYFEEDYGEKWFSFTTGPTDDYLYVDVTSYSPDGIIDPDLDLYLFGPDGVLLAISDAYPDGDPVTDEVEFIDSDTLGFIVDPNSTYYVGVYAFDGADFEVYRFTSAP
jgi:hypothetical protein